MGSYTTTRVGNHQNIFEIILIELHPVLTLKFSFEKQETKVLPGV